jgi:hypothetical protein
MVIAVVFVLAAVAWVGVCVAVRQGNDVGRPPTKLEIAARHMTTVISTYTTSFVVASQHFNAALKAAHKQAEACAAAAGVPVVTVDGLPGDTVYLVDRSKLTPPPPSFVEHDAQRRFYRKVTL